jgi:hypothetical protein
VRFEDSGEAERLFRQESEVIVETRVVSRITGWERCSAMVLFVAATSIVTPAQTFSTLADFNAASGEGPHAPIVALSLL